MLKIKEDIDLEILEKYDFKKLKYIYKLEERWRECPDDEWTYFFVIIDKATREIKVDYGTELALDTLFDMFADGIIEKEVE